MVMLLGYAIEAQARQKAPTELRNPPPPSAALSCLLVSGSGLNFLAGGAPEKGNVAQCSYSDQEPPLLQGNSDDSESCGYISDQGSKRTVGSKTSWRCRAAFATRDGGRKEGDRLHTFSQKVKKSGWLSQHENAPSRQQSSRCQVSRSHPRFDFELQDSASTTTGRRGASILRGANHYLELSTSIPTRLRLQESCRNLLPLLPSLACGRHIQI